jgi:hypothetical protein
VSGDTVEERFDAPVVSPTDDVAVPRLKGAASIMRNTEGLEQLPRARRDRFGETERTVAPRHERHDASRREQPRAAAPAASADDRNVGRLDRPLRSSFR